MTAREIAWHPTDPQIHSPHRLPDCSFLQGRYAANLRGSVEVEKKQETLTPATADPLLSSAQSASVHSV